MREAMAGAKGGRRRVRRRPDRQCPGGPHRRAAGQGGRRVRSHGHDVQPDRGCASTPSPGDLVLIDRSAHIVRGESGAPAALSGVTLKPLPGNHGLFTAADVDAAIEPPHPFNPIHLESPPRLLCVENTHNGGGGTVWPLEQVEEVCAAARRHGLATHLDGARLWHATAATGVSEVRFAAPFDTVNVCFSKGLGAPVGSALAGSQGLVARGAALQAAVRRGLPPGGDPRRRGPVRPRTPPRGTRRRRRPRPLPGPRHRLRRRSGGRSLRRPVEPRTLPGQGPCRPAHSPPDVTAAGSIFCLRAKPGSGP